MHYTSMRGDAEFCLVLFFLLLFWLIIATEVNYGQLELGRYSIADLRIVSVIFRDFIDLVMSWDVSGANGDTPVPACYSVGLGPSPAERVRTGEGAGPGRSDDC